MDFLLANTAPVNNIAMLLGTLFAIILIVLYVYMGKNYKKRFFESYVYYPLPSSVKIISTFQKSYTGYDSAVIKFTINRYDLEKILEKYYERIDMSSYSGELPDWFECSEIYIYCHKKMKFSLFCDALQECVEFRYIKQLKGKMKCQ